MTLNGEDLEYTVVGRATGASQIVGMSIVATTVINSVLTVRNPAGNAAALILLRLRAERGPFLHIWLLPGSDDFSARLVEYKEMLFVKRQKETGEVLCLPVSFL